ncbi:hypothetical protein B0E33_18990 [Roseibium algicola]|uniref:Peptidase S26 domain-containing protein n=1 Tax=Roseibium algicola TaxID=2857014 RepID=A0ABM6I4R0_9HYPH|nr:S26 family signal peptidase [Roseibium aggregatum]AQQ05400.1 hypothetical protein B0E33_18990 [Roseibium aggregatum]
MRTRTLIATVVSVLALAASGAHWLPLKLVYNGSASAPAGYYWVDQLPAKPGDHVLIEPPDAIRKLIEDRLYLPRGVPLIKEIAASNGDTVCRLDRDVLINGMTVAHARATDKKGRPLPNWKGCHLLAENQIFLLQQHPDSFDSRYFGIVERSRILGRATRLSVLSRK